MMKQTVKIKGNLTKETEQAYYYNNYVPNTLYIIRWLKEPEGGWHFYPNENGELPENFETQLEAENYLNNGFLTKHHLDNYKIITAQEASKYPVPKRW